VKSKTKKILIGGMLAVAMLFSLMFGVFFGKAKIAHATDPLPELTGVYVEGDILHWNAYEGTGADGYELVIDGDKEIMIEGIAVTSVNLAEKMAASHLPSGTYTWSICAGDIDDEDGDHIALDGYKTQKKTGTYVYEKDGSIIAVDVPRNPRWTDGKVEWTQPANTVGVSGYEYIVYETNSNKIVRKSATNSLITSFTIGYFLQADTDYYFKVRARTSTDGYCHSDWVTASVKFESVGAFANVKIDKDGIISFDAIEGAVNYRFGFVGESGVENVLTATTTSFDLATALSEKSWFDANKTYNISLVAFTTNSKQIPLTKAFTIENWKLGDEYTQPVEVKTPVAKKGLSAGAIVAIVVPSVIVVSVGTFALVWFVIKKKTWADFVALFKKKK